MKIMFVCHGAGNGGAERVIVTLAHAFLDRGYQVMLFTTRPPYNDYEINEKIERKWADSNNSVGAARHLMVIKNIRSAVSDFAPDCIICFSAIPNIQTLIAKMGKKCRIIISERTDPQRHPSSNIYRFLRKIMYPFADEVVFQTQDAMRYFEKYRLKKKTIIYNPVRSDLPPMSSVPRKKKIVGIGSLGEQKNWMVALKACEQFFLRHPDFTFDIFGEGPDRESLFQYINNRAILKERVTLRGYSADAVKELNNAMMYISSSDYEGISNAMLEALAMGVPCICTDCPVGGARTFIDGSNGILIPVGDYNALAEKMCSLAEDEKLRNSLTLNAITIRNRLALQNIVDIWEKEVKCICIH